MSTPAPPSVVAAFTFGGVVDVDYTIIPVPSQIGVSPELASFTTGFPPATRTARTAGGIPPRGLDMNGILFMTSAHIAWIAAGNGYAFNTDVVATATGYNVGAILRSAVDPQTHFYNTLADNTNDPDSVLTGWLAFNPVTAAFVGDQSETLVVGAQAVALDPGVAFLDAAAHASGSSISALTGASNGQIVTVTNDGSGALTLTFAGGVTILAGESFTVRWRSSTSAWVPIS